MFLNLFKKLLFIKSLSLIVLLTSISPFVYAQDTLQYKLFTKEDFSLELDSIKRLHIFYFFSQASRNCKKNEEILFKDKKYIEVINNNFHFYKVSNSFKIPGTLLISARILKHFLGIHKTQGFFIFWLRKDGKMMRIGKINGFKLISEHIRLLKESIVKIEKIPLDEQFLSVPSRGINEEIDSLEYSSIDSIKIINNPIYSSLKNLKYNTNKDKLLIYFSTESCLPCKEFESDMRRKDFVGVLKDFEVIKYDISNKNGIRAIDELKVTAYPTFITYKPKKLGSKKYVKKRWFGYARNDVSRKWFLEKINKK